MTRRTRFLVWMLALAVVLFLVGRYVVRPSLVVGESMAPTLQHWDLCLMRVTHRYEPRRGDIVMFRTADDPPLYFVKRVLALPGETIAITNGVVIVSGQPLDEPYTNPNPDWQMEPVTVSTGRVFVAGDNRVGTIHGPVATRLVLGRIVQRWRWRK